MFFFFFGSSLEFYGNKKKKDKFYGRMNIITFLLSYKSNNK